MYAQRCLFPGEMRKIFIYIPSYVELVSFCQFITRVISQSVMKLRESADTADMKAASLSRLKLLDTCQWPFKLIELAQDLGLDIDFLKRHQVCELYSAGFDRLAEEVSIISSYDKPSCENIKYCIFPWRQSLIFLFLKILSYAIIQVKCPFQGKIRKYSLFIISYLQQNRSLLYPTCHPLPKQNLGGVI